MLQINFCSIWFNAKKSLRAQGTRPEDRSPVMCVGENILSLRGQAQGTPRITYAKQENVFIGKDCPIRMGGCCWVEENGSGYIYAWFGHECLWSRKRVEIIKETMMSRQKSSREKLCKRRGKVIQFAPRYDRWRRVGKQIESTRITELIERKEFKQIRLQRKNRKRRATSAMRLCIGGIIKLRAKSLLVSSHFKNDFRLTIATNTTRRGRKKLFFVEKYERVFPVNSQFFFLCLRSFFFLLFLVGQRARSISIHSGVCVFTAKVNKLTSSKALNFASRFPFLLDLVLALLGSGYPPRESVIIARV